MIEIRCVAESCDDLGESPLWDPRDGCVYWVDNVKPAFHRYDPKTGVHTPWPMPESVGSIGLRAKGGFVVGMQSGFGFIDPERNIIERVASPEPNLAGNRMNDGKCDRKGRFWCGSMNVKFADNYQVTASLYRFDPDGSCRRMDTGIIVTNGIAFSPDDRVMYLSDSSAKIVWAYDFDLDAGTISNKRIWMTAENTPGHSGKVDGAVVDTEGYYWAALPYDGIIVRYDPKARIDRVFSLPVTTPTMPTFGGPDLDVLYVTSTTKFLNAYQKRVKLMEGGLMEVRGLGFKGLPEPEFAG